MVEDIQRIDSLSFSFREKTMKKIKGVNLGGWFVLESWMKPSLFEGIDSKDETGFSLYQKQAEEKLKKHWETFITRHDFEYLRSIGVTSVRLPIPWWLEGEKPYMSALPYIHQAMQWASELNIDVLLDLHTAPGCQNGFDNGGIQGVMEWHKDPKHIDLTIEKLGFIANTFKHYPSFFGIEVLNEPFVTIDLDIIQDFYRRAYERIRQETDQLIVFHDAFRPEDTSWQPFFEKHKMTHIAFDLHLYHCFSPELINGHFDLHIKEIVEKRIPMIRKIHTFIPVIIGEWSLGINYEKLKKDASFDENLYDQLLASLQLYAYTQGQGYYFWSYKIDRDSHRNWDFRRLIKDGILPKSFSD